MKKPKSKTKPRVRKLTGSLAAVEDPDNPLWTAEDFARAQRPEDVLPPEVLAQFPKHRGPQKAPTKVATSIRLSRDVLAHFRRTGPGWQSRIDRALRKVVSSDTTRSVTPTRRSKKRSSE